MLSIVLSKCQQIIDIPHSAVKFFANIRFVLMRFFI